MAYFKKNTSWHIDVAWGVKVIGADGIANKTIDQP